MARGKKKEELPLEEKLERALVPVEEQPYKVPENWCWTTVESISDIVSKGTTPKGGKSSYVEDGIRFLRVENFLDDGTISHEGMVHIAEDIHLGFLKRSILIKDDVLISIAGTLGKTAIVQEDNLPINTNQAVAFIRLNSKVKILPKYLRFSLVNPMIQNYLLEKTKVTSIPNLTLEIISGCPIPLPPLSEQQRIVERVESLFAKLDEVKEKAQGTLDGSEERKAAILHKAFSGKLTDKWRMENKVFKEWETTTIKECCKIGSGGTPSRKCLEYYHGCIPWIKTGEINWNEIYSAEEYISEMGVENSSAKIYEEGAILVAMYGMGVTRGRAAVLKTKAATNQAVCVLVPCKDVLNYYLFYYFMCNYWDIRKQAVGENQLNLSATIIGTFEIEIPSMEEQKEIVRLLDVLLEKENQNKENIEMVLDYIDMMKKSILARAFRGELGTNSADEESSIELLKQILEQEG